MKTNAERFPGLVVLFRSAIIDAIKEVAPKLEDGTAIYAPSTASLRAAAFKAMKEVVESEADAVDAMLAVNVWNAVMLTNESAFHQGLKRSIEAKTVTGLKLVEGTKATASSYVE